MVLFESSLLSFNRLKNVTSMVRRCFERSSILLNSSRN